ncbi:MAG: hypothetical protein ABWZ98_12435 [Nakamurella sp.]
MNAQLPFLDEHSTEISADVVVVWPILLDAIDRSFAGAGRYARLVGSADNACAGPRPLTVGSTLPGFRVAIANPEVELALQGRHRFSTYALTFRLEQLSPGTSLLRAESRAHFPGAAGAGYRLLVVGSRGHVILVRRLLNRVKHRSESGATSLH